jgi:hypothetical protein
VANKGAHIRIQSRRARVVAVAGLAAGCVVGATAALLVGSAIAQRTQATPRAVIDATHVPALLTLAGEPVSLTWDVHCAPAGVEDPEQACEAAGSVFVRPAGDSDYRELPLRELSTHGLRQLTADVPQPLANGRDGLDYYAVLGPVSGDSRLVQPPGGAAAPYRARRLVDPVEVDLGDHQFGETRSPSARVATARWGDGPFDVGLEEARNLDPIGASSFDVDAAGTVFLLDEAHRRLLRWASGGNAPARVPLSIDGRLADLTVAGDGSIFVLESVPPAGRSTPVVRRFDVNGRDLDVIETAERAPAQIRPGPNGPVVLENPSHQWMPVAVGGEPASPAAQRAHGHSGRPLRGGGEVVVLRRGNEIRVALVDGGAVKRSWRVTSETALGEVPLAEPLGRRLLLVVRVYSESQSEFVALVVGRHGLDEQFAVDAADWAETAPLARFRLVGGSLYRLGSSPAGAFVDRFDLEVH